MAKQVEKPEWERVAEAFEASGQTQREFVLARGGRLSTLRSWVYRHRRSAPSRVEPVRLLPVQVAASPVATEAESAGEGRPESRGGPGAGDSPRGARGRSATARLASART
ncbi:IS66 family insertion sequence element accessory protein TnpA [Corallococcus exercitus]|uniref:IS66 family insertion sequence element accessory protein TnpA n=1 Tax=Corallococcus exercitus TaxID=2316736 RepID=UPI003F5BC7B0